MTFLDLLVEAAPAAGASGNSQILVAVLGSGAIAAVVGAIVTGLFSKRKLGAEATEIITKAASSVTTDLRAELTRVQAAREASDVAHREEITELNRRHEDAMDELMADHREEMEEVRRVLQLHVAWDAIAISRFNSLLPLLPDGGDPLPPAPPVLPPSRGHSIHAV